MGRNSYYNEEIGNTIYNKKHFDNKTLQEIADELNIVTSTVFNYLNRFERENNTKKNDELVDFLNEQEDKKTELRQLPSVSANVYPNNSLDFHLENDEELHVYCLSDMHIGNPQCNYEFLAYATNMIGNDPCQKIILGGGDFLEIGTTRIPSSAFGQNISVNKQIDKLMSYLEPLKEYFVGLVNSNHLARVKKEFDLDVSKILSNMLECEYSTGGLITNITVNGKPLTIYTTHGRGSSSRKELAYGKIKRETSFVNADITFYGHLHRTGYIDDVEYINEEYRRKYYILAGSFLTYKNSYAYEMGLKPLPEGFTRVAINNRAKIRVDVFNEDECVY